MGRFYYRDTYNLEDFNTMKFDKDGIIILDHSLCLCCQTQPGKPHLCCGCQWARAMDWLSGREAEHKKTMDNYPTPLTDEEVFA